MMIGTILLAVGLFLIVGAYLLRPLLAVRSMPLAVLSRQAVLGAEKASYLAQIRALEFDHETGQLPTETYQLQRAQLMQAAAETLRQIEQLGDEDVDSEIEAAILVLRRPQNDLLCPHCGEKTSGANRFCGQCGGAL